MTYLTIALMLSLSAAKAKPVKPAKPPPDAAAETPPVPSASSDDPVAKAKELFQWAQKLYAQARYAEAITKFEEAYLLKPHPVIYFNIGKCYEQLGETAKALRNYRDYLRLSPDAADKQTVSDAIANLERRLKEKGVQQLIVFSEPANAKIDVDGKPLGSSPASIELGAGNHTLSVKAEGFEGVERSFVMSTQHATEMTITLRPVTKDSLKQPSADSSASPATPAPDATATATTQPGQQKKGGRLFCFVAAGLGLAGIGAGAGLGVMAMGASNQLLTVDANRTTAQADQLVSTAQTMALGANVSYIAGGVFLAAAVLLFILGI